VSDGRHSFLILAHDDEAMLRRLVGRIAPMGSVFVHIDAKTDTTQWLLGEIAACLVSPRIPVYWGDWSIVEATTVLLERALADPLTTRFTLISGLDYPILSNAEIVTKANESGNVVASRSAPNMPDGSRPEVDYERRFYRSKNAAGSWAKLKNGVMNRIVYSRRELDWRAVAPTSGMRAGEQWWSIDREFAEYCVAQIRSRRPLVTYFQKIVCSDEKVFATLYGEFAGEMGREGISYAKWRGGSHPTAITRDDIADARATGDFWFARKFHSADAETLDWLDELER
jgi:hypothetical protein